MKEAKAQATKNASMAKQLEKSAEENKAFLRRTGSVVTPLPVPDVVVAPPPRPRRRSSVPAPDVVVVIVPEEAPKEVPVVVAVVQVPTLAPIFNTPPYVHRGDRAVSQNTRVRPPHPFDHIDVVAVAEVHPPPRNVVPRLTRNVSFLLDEEAHSEGFEDSHGTWSK